MQLRLTLVPWLLLAGCKTPDAPAPEPWERCAGPARGTDEELDRAEAALDRGERRVLIDANGCRVMRGSTTDAGARRYALEVVRGVIVRDGHKAPDLTVPYVRERSPGRVRDLFDLDGDGVFERELFEREDDAGWVERETLTRGDAGTVRVRELRQAPWSKRTVRERFIDGGWQVESDERGPAKPRVVPITP